MMIESCNFSSQKYKKHPENFHNYFVCFEKMELNTLIINDLT